MTERVRLAPAAKPARSIPARVSRSLFGVPAVIPGEDRAEYDALRARVRAAIGPVDFLEELSVEGVVARTWQIERWRRFEAALLKATAPDALATVLAPLRDVGPGDDLIERWSRHEAGAVDEVERILAAAGLDMSVVMATAFAKNLAVFQGLEHLINAAEMRREHMLREIERRRLRLGRDLRHAVAAVDAVDPDT